ncbi:MAG: hypothetical protein HC887_04970 [Desulfobacteraceae bacterium]|nr:hypothetical protein [Desulfobacteraceae bacterium]
MAAYSLITAKQMVYSEQSLIFSISDRSVVDVTEEDADRESDLRRLARKRAS